MMLISQSQLNDVMLCCINPYDKIEATNTIAEVHVIGGIVISYMPTLALDEMDVLGVYGNLSRRRNP